MTLYNRLVNKEESLALVGLGYVRICKVVSAYPCDDIVLCSESPFLCFKGNIVLFTNIFNVFFVVLYKAVNKFFSRCWIICFYK